MLGAILVPTNIRERKQILANFTLWAKDEFAPTITPLAFKPHLVFVFNNDTASPLESEITEAFLSNGMQRYFAEPEFRYLGLTAEQDVYVRSYALGLASGREGYKAGPNNQFFGTIRLGRHFGHYSFFMETDCVPIRQNWLARLIQIALGPERFYILGSAYRGRGTIGLTYNRHLNGNALYACGDPGFQSFVNDFWEPSLRRIVATEDRRVAYDCILEMLFTKMQSNVEGDHIWPVWQQHAHLFRYSDYIQDISARKDVEEPPPDLVQNILTNSPHTYILHSQPIARAAVKMLSSGEPIEPELLRPEAILPGQSEQSATDALGFVTIHPSSAVKRKGSAYALPTGSSDNYVMVLFAGTVAAGDQVEGRVTVHLSNRSTVTISLSRHGDTPFEGTNQTSELPAGEHSLKVSHRFRNSHQAARMQIGVDGTPTNISFPGNIEMVKL